MHWIVQNNMFNEASFEALLVQLDRQKVPHDLVKVIPFARECEPDVNPQGLVYVCGSYALTRIAKKKGWFPGAFINPDYDRIMQIYGEEMLNYDAKITTLREFAIPDADEFFIRPIGDSKKFSGAKMHKLEFVNWRERVLALEGNSTYTTLTPDDPIVVAMAKEIYAEYRFFIVDREVVTGSRYKLGDRLSVSTDIPRDVEWYVAKFVTEMHVPKYEQPSRAYCLDIAVTPEGNKVIEVNNINSSGFYALDMGKYVDAINRMQF